MQNKMISTYKGVSDLVCLRPPEGMKDYILTREEAELLYKELGETLAHLTPRAADICPQCCVEKSVGDTNSIRGGLVCGTCGKCR
jgi:hypothetical protein